MVTVVAKPHWRGLNDTGGGSRTTAAARQQRRLVNNDGGGSAAHDGGGFTLIGWWLKIRWLLFVLCFVCTA
jgi:hypothetical protein